MTANGPAFERTESVGSRRLAQEIHSEGPGRFADYAGRADDGSAAGYARARNVKRWGQPSGGGYGN